MPGDGNAIGGRLKRSGDHLKKLSDAFIGLPGAFLKHRGAVLSDDLDVEALSRLPHHDVFGSLGQIRQAL
jgi:hypothetical protein